MLVEISGLPGLESLKEFTGQSGRDDAGVNNATTERVLQGRVQSRCR
jgi:hypothetical protein